MLNYNFINKYYYKQIIFETGTLIKYYTTAKQQTK